MTPKLFICPLDYSGKPGVSHSGLHVSSLNTTKVLRENGVDANCYPVVSAFPIPNPPPTITTIQELCLFHEPTHVVTCAFWVAPGDMQKLCLEFPQILFAVNCHSNIAFLRVEPGGLSNLRALVDLETTSMNFHVAGNSHGFEQAVTGPWRAPCAYLPNLYYLDGLTPTNQPLPPGATLRIGTFGALRPEKNHTTATWAALGIAQARNCQLEYFVNTRNDGEGKRILAAIHAIMDGLPYAKLIEVPWQAWPAHRRLVRSMNLLIQPSFTETFLLVAADAVAEGVPVVGSDCIEWLPRHWKADPDNVEDCTRVGLTLLSDHRAQAQGLAALQRNNILGVAAWKGYLGL
jgi:hypothetical protein